MSRKKNNLSQRRQFLIILAAALHFLGATLTFFVGGKNTPGSKFDLFLYLIRFFSWWSVHTSILTIWAALMIFKERKRKSPSYFSQLITFLATVYNLVTLFFWTYCLFFLDVQWENSLFLDIWLVSWHVIAPLLTIFYFYLPSRTDRLRKKIVKTLSLSLLSPTFYFFYVCILAQINQPTSSLFPYMEQYPYFIFEWIAKRRWNYFILNFFVACVVFLTLCSSLLWTNKLIEQKQNKKK